MTRNEVIANWDVMTARERDAWVAEVVFGWSADAISDAMDAWEHGVCGICQFPYYTTDISAAWTVLVHMNADHYVKIERISERVNVTGNYVSEVGGHYGWGTAEEAICLAAVIAKLSV